MLRNIACSCDKGRIAAILDEAGLRGCYNFVHVPKSQNKKKTNVGYAFVGFKSPAFADRCQQLFSGKTFGQSATTQLCEVTLAHHQEKIPFMARKKVFRQMQRDPMNRCQEWISL